MVDIILFVSSTAVGATTCLCEKPANLCAQAKVGAHPQKLVPGGVGTNSAADALISAAASCLLFTSLVLLLKATLHYATNWHGTFLWLFLRVTLLGASTVDRTCPVHDEGSAGTRRGDPSLSHASAQPSLPLAAGGRRNVGRKRPGDDGSDAEENNRGKRPRLVSRKGSKARVRCPFKDHDPDNPEYEKCGRFSEWSRLREHLLDRKHKPRDRCPTCGEIFTDDVAWDLHTSVLRTCKPSPKALDRPFWVDRHQAAEIRELSTRGRKNEGSLEEMYRKVCLILFGSESAPDRAASGHPIWAPHAQHTDDLGVDHRRQEPWNILKRTICSLLGVQNVPEDDSMQRVIDSVRSYLGYPKEQAGGAAVEEHLGNNGAVIEDWMPSAAPSQGQAPGISERDRYPPGGSDGHLEHSLSNLSTHLSEGAGNPSPPGSLDPDQASSVGHNLDKLGYDSEYIDPVLLQRSDAHHTHVPVSNDSFPAVRACPTSTTVPSGSAASQESEATFLGSFCDQLPKDIYYQNDGEVLDDLDNFDFSVEGFSPDAVSMQLSEDRDPDPR
ncbi:hypothetical protein INS49_014068 [Diaporthe citri]|uniref:uncharacterized protein n=1 Tax=Diaporthe citri TaxID=83186 RepID=UPI001C820EFE|nr:uncharacterized protein INS49_014068 [Diaporthe citri]KAG6358184.1 hypothetical protein INS49_014068 [Diaporthe citri]